MRYALKPPCEMTAEELAHTVTQSTGLPVPPVGASTTTRLEWFASAVFLIHHQHIQDAIQANIAAANVLLQMANYQDMVPYIEQVLRRQLTEYETTLRSIKTIA